MILKKKKQLIPLMEKGSFNFDREKIESHYFLSNLSIFFHESPDFPLSGVGRSV